MKRRFMVIGIDARLISQTGVGRYIKNIVGQLSLLDTANKYKIFLMKDDLNVIDFPQNFEKIETNICWHSISEQIVLPIRYKKLKLDLLFVPHFNVPIFYPGKFITTIHDLTVLRVKTGRVTTLPYPLFLIKYAGAFLAYFVALKRSQKIFTVSDFVKKDIIKTFKVRPDKIELTPCAAEPPFSNRSREEVAASLKKYNIKQPYLFYVGNAHPHKNLENLIKAFEIISDKKPDLTLVLGGKKDFFYQRLEKEYEKSGIGKKISFVGFIDDKDLPALYSGAECFINPSLYEGFGIQVLEAFSCGCKVVCSNATSLPEVGGDLASYFDPRNPENIAQVTLEAVEKDIPNYQTLAQMRATNFSWKSSGRVVYEAIRNYENSFGF